MKQLLLATALIALPVAAFTGFNVLAAKTNVSAITTTGLGDMSIFTSIITDVQASAAKGDFAAAKTRIKDFEIAWDENEIGLRPMDPDHWDLIDGAADAALTAARSAKPDPGTITETLAALQASLETPVVKK
jgi:hypothetical protein